MKGMVCIGNEAYFNELAKIQREAAIEHELEQKRLREAEYEEIFSDVEFEPLDGPLLEQYPFGD